MVLYVTQLLGMPIFLSAALMKTSFKWEYLSTLFVIKLPLLPAAIHIALENKKNIIIIICSLNCTVFYDSHSMKMINL